MAENFENTGVVTIDIKKYLFKILAKWYLFAISLFLAWLYVYVQNKYVIPQYELSTTILLEHKSSRPEGILGNLQLLGDKRNLENEIWYIKSHIINRKAINELDFGVSYYSILRPFRVGKPLLHEIYNETPIIFEADSSDINIFGKIVKLIIISEEEYKINHIDETEIGKKMRFGEKYSEHDMNFSITFKPDIDPKNYINNEYACIINNTDPLARSYGQQLRVSPVTRDGDILKLSITMPVKQKACDYLNKLVDIYLREDLKQKNRFAYSAIEFIDEQLASVADSLTVAEDSLQDYRLKAQMFSSTEKGNSIFERLDELQTQKSLLSIERNYYNYMLSEIEKGNNVYNIMSPSLMGVEAPEIDQVYSEWIELTSEKEVLQYSIKKDIPSIKLINAKIKNLKKILNSGIDNRKKIVHEAIKKIDSEIQEQIALLYDLPVAERRISTITRKFNINDNIYTYLLQKRAEAGISLASNKSDIIVLDEALPNNSRYISANKAKLSTSMVIGFLIPLVIILALDYFDTKIRSKNEIVNKLSIPVIGEIGSNTRSTSIPVASNPKSSIAESFRTLRTNLQYLFVDKDNKIISVTSTISGEGKTFCAINLAAIIAMSNKKTLLIGLDMRKPQIHNYLNLNNDIGISNYLIKQNSIDEVIKTSEIKDLDILVSGPVPPNPAELIETDRMQELIEEVKKRYDYVIIDTPPVALVTDALLISKFTDANIYVIRINYSNKSVLGLIKEIYKNKGMNNLSLVLNDIRLRGRYGYLSSYQYGYGYYKSYGQGYYDDEKDPHIKGLKRVIKRMGRKAKNKLLKG